MQQKIRYCGRSSTLKTHTHPVFGVLFRWLPAVYLLFCRIAGQLIMLTEAFTVGM